MIAAIERIERRLARIESSIERVDSLACGAPALIATATDTFDGIASELADRGVSIDERGRAVLSLLEHLTRGEAVSSLHGLLDSGLFAPGTIEALSNLAKALPASQDRAPHPVGPWRAYRALKEPDVQRALGFLLDVARRLGSSLSANELATRLSKGH